MQSFKRSNVNKIKSINNIRYYCSVHSHNASRDYKFSFNKHNLPLKDIVYDIKLDPSDYNSNSKNLLELREKFIITNNSVIPTEGLLQLGEDFCLPPTDNANSITQCIKHIENNFSRLQGNINKFRN